jgi:hypothetical protein
MSQLALTFELDYGRLWEAAYEDGHNKRRLFGPRLVNYADTFVTFTRKYGVLRSFDDYYALWSGRKVE